MERDDRVKYHWDIMVAGVSREGRYKAVEDHVYEGDDCLLVRERNNPHDKNAVRVHTLRGHMVGYVPRDNAELLSQYMDDGCHLYNAFFSRVLDKGKHPIPCVRINAYLSSAQIDDRTLRKPSSINYKTPGKRSTGIRSDRRRIGYKLLPWIILIIFFWWLLS